MIQKNTKNMPEYLRLCVAAFYRNFIISLDY